VINPGTRPLDSHDEADAHANLLVFLDAVRTRGGTPGEPRRDAGLDRDGRYGWVVPMGGDRSTLLLMPGVPLTQLRDDITAEAPCLYVNGGAWWWSDALNMAIPSPSTENL
jgi:hypothetical protein